MRKNILYDILYLVGYVRKNKLYLNNLKSFYKQEFNVYLYQNESGNNPVLDYILQLDAKQKTKVIYLIELLANYGNKLGEPYSKHLQENLFELRTTSQLGAERIIYCFIEGKNCILLHGFTKKTQKTPKKQLEVAKERYKDIIKKIKEK